MRIVGIQFNERNTESDSNRMRKKKKYVEQICRFAKLLLGNSFNAASYAIRFAHFKSYFMQFRFLFFLFMQKLVVKMNTHALDRETLIQIVRQFKGFAKIV